MPIFKRGLRRNIVRMSEQKINYPSAERNKMPILEVLEKHFAKTKPGDVLEVSSGTGQHVAFFARHYPLLTFQPSEYDSSLFDSIKAYALDTPTNNIRDPIFIDITIDSTQWNITSSSFDYVININMVHVAPFVCSIGLFKNVGKVLKPGGILVTYGPYANNGVLEPQSNRDFDRHIRQRNPEWGVRDIQDLIRLADAHNMSLTHTYEMPANNKCLIWEKSF